MSGIHIDPDMEDTETGPGGWHVTSPLWPLASVFLTFLCFANCTGVLAVSKVVSTSAMHMNHLASKMMLGSLIILLVPEPGLGVPGTGTEAMCQRLECFFCWLPVLGIYPSNPPQIIVGFISGLLPKGCDHVALTHLKESLGVKEERR